MHWLKHAFAVEQPGPAEPTEPQRAVVERVCREVVRRRLTTPLLVGFEMARPLNYVGAQALHLFAPVLSVFTGADALRDFALFLEHRGSIEYICQRIEALEAEATKRETGDARYSEAAAKE